MHPDSREIASHKAQRLASLLLVSQLLITYLSVAPMETIWPSDDHGSDMSFCTATHTALPACVRHGAEPRNSIGHNGRDRERVG